MTEREIEEYVENQMTETSLRWLVTAADSAEAMATADKRKEECLGDILSTYVVKGYFDPADVPTIKEIISQMRAGGFHESH